MHFFAEEVTVDSPVAAEEPEEDAEQNYCCLSADNIAGSGVKTLQFQGQFQHHQVLILLDSGSSISFISNQLVSRLSIVTT